MITLTHGERCRTPFWRDPRPSKTHGGPPWRQIIPPACRCRGCRPVRLSATRTNQPSTLASEIFIIDLNMLKNGLISC